MKIPEEIKKTLNVCDGIPEECEFYKKKNLSGCPYVNSTICYECAMLDALEYIESLEKQIANDRPKESYTAIAYDADGDESYEQFDDKIEAIEFAAAKKWNKVVNDITGKIIWRYDS